MIRIAITAAAYAAIRDSLPPAAPQKAVGGLYVVSVPENTVDKLADLSRPSESISDTIIRLAAAEHD
jgi:hypothetical protein